MRWKRSLESKGWGEGGSEDVLIKSLIEFKYESYQEVYYINKTVTRITIKQKIKSIDNKKIKIKPTTNDKIK